MEEKEGLKLKIKICMRVSLAGVIVMVVSLLLELVLIRFFGTAAWAKKLVKIFGILAMVSPFVILVPLFFRVNYQSRLIMLQREKRQKKETEDRQK